MPDMEPKSPIVESVKLWLAIALALYALWNFS